MPKLNLQAKDETQKIIKEYLEEHVSDTLAEKINNGVLIQKDGKSLLNKKNAGRLYRIFRTGSAKARGKRSTRRLYPGLRRVRLGDPLF